MKTSMLKQYGLILFSAAALLSSCKLVINEEKKQTPIVSFEQGWTADEAVDFYNTSQGSQLMPYAWFLALEQPDNTHLFRDDKNIKKLGYIPQSPLAGRNPDGLPVGFVKDNIQEPFITSVIGSERLGTSQNRNKEWLGLTCAACHTSEIIYGKQTLRINGGPPLSDMPALLTGLQKSLAATLRDDAKLTRFAKKVLPREDYNEIEKQTLKTQMQALDVWLNDYIDVNYGGLVTPYGYGRLDAFGAILNRVTASLLEIPSNGAPANAPVSYPFLWNTSQLDWVQWNGSANNYIGRNGGEVSGVFAHTILKTTNEKDRFYSSANIINLDHLEKLVSQLDSPKWGAPLPAIDQAKAAAGAELYASNCVSCHGIRDSSGQFPMTKVNAAGKAFIKIHMTGLADIGTDPLMVSNFVNPALNADPGELRPYLDESIRGNAKVPRGALLTVAVQNILARKLSEFKQPLTPNQLMELTGNHLPDETPPNLIAYKARPLNGIWATAPYMHNGSIANLYQTLLPDAERETSFYVGSQILDTEKVGFSSTKEGNYFLFNTVDSKGAPIPGNSNKGHSGKTFTKTLGKDGQWRDFTEAERYQLIEYMKTL